MFISVDFHVPKVSSCVCTAWCSEIGYLTTLDAPELHASVTSENQFHCTRLYVSVYLCVSVCTWCVCVCVCVRACVRACEPANIHVSACEHQIRHMQFFGRF